MTKRPEPGARRAARARSRALASRMALPQRLDQHARRHDRGSRRRRPINGRADLPALADSLQMEVDDLFPVAETLQLLRFAELEEGDIKLTPGRHALRRSRTDARKKLFGDHLLAYVPLAARIKRVLDERPSHTRARDALPRRARRLHVRRICRADA